jgi:hypothetical protein
MGSSEEMSGHEAAGCRCRPSNMALHAHVCRINIQGGEGIGRREEMHIGDALNLERGGTGGPEAAGRRLATRGGPPGSRRYTAQRAPSRPAPPACPTGGSIVQSQTRRKRRTIERLKVQDQRSLIAYVSTYSSNHCRHKHPTTSHRVAQQPAPGK